MVHWQACIGNIMWGVTVHAFVFGSRPYCSMFPHKTVRGCPKKKRSIYIFFLYSFRTCSSSYLKMLWKAFWACLNIWSKCFVRVFLNIIFIYSLKSAATWRQMANTGPNVTTDESHSFKMLNFLTAWLDWAMEELLTIPTLTICCVCIIWSPPPLTFKGAHKSEQFLACPHKFVHFSDVWAVPVFQPLEQPKRL